MVDEGLVGQYRLPTRGNGSVRGWVPVEETSLPKEGILIHGVSVFRYDGSLAKEKEDPRMCCQEEGVRNRSHAPRAATPELEAALLTAFLFLSETTYDQISRQDSSYLRHGSWANHYGGNGADCRLAGGKSLEYTPGRQTLNEATTKRTIKRATKRTIKRTIKKATKKATKKTMKRATKRMNKRTTKRPTGRPRGRARRRPRRRPACKYDRNC